MLGQVNKSAVPGIGVAALLLAGLLMFPFLAVEPVYAAAADVASEGSAGRQTGTAAAQESAWPARFVGVWSNQRGEFQTVNLALRHDGRGLFATAVFSMLARWEATEQGLHVKATLPAEDAMGQFVAYDLAYDAQRNVLLLMTKDGEQRLVKVGSDEPDDLEAEVEASLAEKRAPRKGLEPAKTVPVKGREALLEQLKGLWSNPTASGKQMITSPGQPWELTIRAMPGEAPATIKAYVSVPVLHQSVELPKPLFRKVVVGESPLADLPIRYRMPASQRDTLKQWLEQTGYRYKFHTILGKSIWALEECRQQFSVGPIDDRNDLVKVVDYLLRGPFAAGGEEYRVLVQGSGDF